MFILSLHFNISLPLCSLFSWPDSKLQRKSIITSLQVYLSQASSSVTHSADQFCSVVQAWHAGISFCWYIKQLVLKKYHLEIFGTFLIFSWSLPNRQYPQIILLRFSPQHIVGTNTTNNCIQNFHHFFNSMLYFSVQQHSLHWHIQLPAQICR